jgi:hypothetical protein
MAGCRFLDEALVLGAQSLDLAVKPIGLRGDGLEVTLGGPPLGQDLLSESLERHQPSGLSILERTSCES